jgi:hypothetical protein
MVFTLTLRRNKPKLGYDGEPPKDGAVSYILAWSIDHLTPEEIDSLVVGLDKFRDEQPIPDSKPRHALTGDARGTASFLRRFPEAARIGQAGGIAHDASAPASARATSSFLERFPEASRIGINTYRR